MKKIEAIIKNFKLDEVREALTSAGVQGVTASEVRGFGRTGGKPELHHGSTYVMDFVPKIKLEIVVPDHLVHQVMEVILASARTSRMGDGKIFVEPVEAAVRIRTGERNEDAL